MIEAKLTWSIWQALLNAFGWAFTRRGFHRFAEWITAMAINVEEHTKCLCNRPDRSVGRGNDEPRRHKPLLVISLRPLTPGLQA